MRNLLVFFAIFLISVTVFPQEPAGNPVTVDLPVLDAPFNFSNDFLTVPSMRQSMELSNDFYLTLHRVIGGEDTNPSTGRKWGIIGFDFLSTWVPLSNSWMHEEWHRAVMSRRQIGSFNDVNTLPVGSTLIAVSHVTDADLVRLKRDHPEEMVRLSSAGMESQIAQNFSIEKRHFFDGAKTYDRMLLLINNLSVTFYLSTCVFQGDEETDKQNQEDGADVSRRDFTGLDCTAWTYDLFRPNEPYSARGTHPSGVGLDRYIRYSDLNERERTFLRMQIPLSLLNLADPFLWGRESFRANVAGEDIDWNARLGYFMTSFGYTVDAHLFLKNSENRFLFTLHNGFTDAHYFPGATLEWVEKPLGPNIFLSTSVTVWNQPEEQRLETTSAETLVSAGGELKYQWTPATSTYWGLNLKTPGWMAGDVYLDRNFSTWVGLRTQIF